MWERGEERKRRRLRGGGGVVVWCGGVVLWCGVVVCVSVLRNKFLSRVRTLPVLSFVRSSLQNLDEEELAHHVVGNDSAMYKVFTHTTHTTKHSFTMQGSFLMGPLAL